MFITETADAWQEIANMSSLLGITDIFKELDCTASSTTDYTTYFFHQVYNDTPVYGRNITLTVKNNRPVSLNSSYLPINSDIVEAAISKKAAKKAAKNYLNGGKTIGTPKQVIYSIDNYEASPVSTYVITVQKDIITNVFVNALTGEVITDIPNILSL